MAIMRSASNSSSKSLGYIDYIISLGLYGRFKAYCTSLHKDYSINRKCVFFLKHLGYFDFVKLMVKNQVKNDMTLYDIVHTQWVD